MANGKEPERKKARPVSVLNSHLRKIRREASDIIETISTATASQCDADHKLLVSRFKMDERFDVGSEKLILSEAMAVWQATRHADGSYMPPPDIASRHHKPREYSVSEELRELERHAKALGEEVQRSREELREYRADATEKELPRLRKCSAALKEVAAYSESIGESLDAMQTCVRFRRGERSAEGMASGRG